MTLNKNPNSTFAAMNSAFEALVLRMEFAFMALEELNHALAEIKQQHGKRSDKSPSQDQAKSPPSCE